MKVYIFLIKDSFLFSKLSLFYFKYYYIISFPPSLFSLQPLARVLGSELQEFRYPGTLSSVLVLRRRRVGASHPADLLSGQKSEADCFNSFNLIRLQSLGLKG